MDNYPASRLNALVEPIDLGVMVLDDNLCIRHWNGFIAQHSGKSLEQSIGKSFSETFPDASMDWISNLVELARNCPDQVYSQWLEPPLLPGLFGRTPDGKEKQRQGSLFFPFETSAGVRSYGLVVYDTSAIIGSHARLDAVLAALCSKQEEQDQLLRKLEIANSQLLRSEGLAAIGQLAAGVAHEINNPIGFVFSNLKTLSGYVHDLLKIVDAVEGMDSLDELRQLKRQLEYDYIRSDVEALINESEDGIDRVKRIISALKDFSHIDEEEFRPADLRRGLDATLNVVNNELKYKAEVIKEYGELPEVECILSQINQVVMNLLINAAHSIEKFGRITLRTGTEQDQVWIEVEDTGTGIEAGLLNRIFEPFFTTKPVGKGTGLGLALSYNIVQKHNGRIEVFSEVGEGSRFRVYLPILQLAGKQK